MLHSLLSLAHMGQKTQHVGQNPWLTSNTLSCTIKYACIACDAVSYIAGHRSTVPLQHGVHRNPDSEGTFGVGSRDEAHRFYSPQHSQATLLCTASPGPAAYM